jgi:hypothetical protein
MVEEIIIGVYRRAGCAHAARVAYGDPPEMLVDVLRYRDFELLVIYGHPTTGNQLFAHYITPSQFWGTAKRRPAPKSSKTGARASNRLAPNWRSYRKLQVHVDVERYHSCSQR